MSKATNAPWQSDGAYVFAGKDCIAICDTDNASPETYAANAALMAAAPDGLRLAKRIVACAQQEEMSNGTEVTFEPADAALLLNMAEILIAKAEAA